MSATDAFWSNDLVLSVQNETDENVPVAGIRGVEIIAANETQELYTMDSTFREAVRQFEHNVNVEITYAMFSMDLAQEWLGGGGASATGSQDTSEPALFAIEAVSESVDGSIERTVGVADVVFPEMPIVQATQDEFEEWDLSGSGREITQLEDTSAE